MDIFDVDNQPRRPAAFPLRSISSLGTFAIAIGVLSGCANSNNMLDFIYDKYVVNAAVVNNAKEPTDGANEPDPLNLDCYVFPQDRARDGKTREVITFPDTAKLCAGQPMPEAKKDTAYRTALDAAGKPEGKTYRNQLYDMIKQRSISVCTVHKAHILANIDTWGFAAGTTKDVLSAVASVMGGSAAVSAAAAAVGITKSQSDANFLHNNLAPAIRAEIDKIRDEKLAALEPKLQLSSADYSVDAMLADMVDYHLSCSFAEGVASLAAGDKAPVRTRAQVQGEIDQLEKEQAELAKVFQESDGTDKDITNNSVAAEAKARWNVNNDKLRNLYDERHRLPSAGVSEPAKPEGSPGSNEVNVDQKTIDEAKKKLAALETAHEAETDADKKKELANKIATQKKNIEDMEKALKKK